MKKLGLKDLKVKSFVTSVDNQISKTVKGGFTNNQQAGCDSVSPEECGINTLFPNCPTIFTDCNCDIQEKSKLEVICTTSIKTYNAGLCFDL